MEYRSPQFGVFGNEVEKVSTRTGLADVLHNKAGKCGAPKRDHDEFQTAVSSVLLHKGTKLRSLSVAKNIPKLSFFDAKMDGVIMRHSSSVKPALIVKNKLERLRYASSFIGTIGVNGKTVFSCTMNYILIDKNGFILQKKNQTTT